MEMKDVMRNVFSGKVLDDEILDKIGGGVLTDEARDWANRNINKVEERLKEANSPFAGMGKVGVMMAESSSDLINTAGLKNLIKDISGVDVSDLT